MEDCDKIRIEMVLDRLVRLRDNDLRLFSDEQIELLRWKCLNMDSEGALLSFKETLQRAGLVGDISREMVEQLGKAMLVDGDAVAPPPRELGIEAVSGWTTIAGTHWREVYDKESSDIAS